jgi:hypothetical protein
MATKDFNIYSVYDMEIQTICEEFISSLGLSYFHFRRNFKDGTFFVLSNKSDILMDFINGKAKEINYHASQSIHQSLVHFWDEILSEELMQVTREKHSLHHGITILERYKDHFDCFAFAMPKPLSSPTSYYLQHFRDLKRFCQNFPLLAHNIINSNNIERIRLEDFQLSNHKFLFLPERSCRIELTSESNHYITTYELLCMQ